MIHRFFDNRPDTAGVRLNSALLWHIWWHVHRKYRKTSNKSRTLVGNKFVDNSDVVGASPVGAAPTTSLFST